MDVLLSTVVTRADDSESWKWNYSRHSVDISMGGEGVAGPRAPMMGQDGKLMSMREVHPIIVPRPPSFFPLKRFRGLVILFILPTPHFSFYFKVGQESEFLFIKTFYPS